jgi:hypothetical protein
MMTTKENLIIQCKEENPTMTSIINGEEIQLTNIEYNQVCADWAEMRLQQIAEENLKAQAEATKAALLARLGITEEEARLLLS